MMATRERAGSTRGRTAAMGARMLPARALAAALLSVSAACATAKTSQQRASSAADRGPTAPGSSADERWEARTDRRPSSGGEAPSLPAALAAARGAVGVETPEIGGKPAPRDCALFIGAVFAAGGVDLFADARDTDGGVRAVYRYVQRRGRLRPRGPPAAGTRGCGGEPMNLRRPHDVTNGSGERINAFLRRKRPREPARLAHRHLMSELFAGFCSVLAVETASAACAGGA